MKKIMQNKKYRSIMIGVIIIFFLLCFWIFKDRKMVCRLESNHEQNGYVMNTTYTVTYKKGIVKRLMIQEAITSKDSALLDSLEKDWEKQYQNNQKIFGGYTYQVTHKKDKVSSEVVLDFRKMNMNRYLRINSALKEYANDKNQITKKGIQTMYEKSGAICK